VPLIHSSGPAAFDYVFDIGGTRDAQAFLRHRRATLDVAVTNPRAQLLYERLGFVIEAVRVSKLENRRGRVEDQYRMSRLVGAPENKSALGQTLEPRDT
jgi:ribosomal protein S18 acetylase RimI-like enzyme